MNAPHGPDDRPVDPAGLERLARQAGGRLRASAEGLDARTRSRLTQARHAALAQAVQGGVLARWLGLPGLRNVLQPALWRGWQRWVPAGALAASVLLVALLVLRVPGPGQPLPAAASLEDAELLADSDVLALVQESTQASGADGADAPDAQAGFDFYDWAVDADAQDAGGAVGS
jgi:hypothetical protein